jgi:HD superfamily phosphodiesterase
MYLIQFETFKDSLIDQLKQLDPRLSYHNIHHTLDVVDQVERIAMEENIEAEREIFLLKLAALYHDSGFLHTYDGHEEMSCRIFLKDVASFNLTKEEVKHIEALIMVTKISSEPTTLAEMIIRDADLDYLGRSDFHETAELLKKELFQFGFIHSESDWNSRQLAFLKDQHYYSTSSQRLREPVKQDNYLKLLKRFT